jgi:hypothetical protein
LSASIFTLIPKIMASVGAIGKNQKNEFQKYKFRGIDDLYNAVQPAFVSAGVFCVPSVQDFQTFESAGKDGKVSFRVLLKMSHRFYAPDGSFVDVVTMGEGLDTSDKASNKAMSAAMKYAFIELLSLPTEDIEDSDRESPEAKKPTKIDSRQPGPGDGAPHTGPSVYVIPAGHRWNKRRLHEIPEGELRADVESRESKPKHEPWEITYLLRAKEYLETLGNFEPAEPTVVTPLPKKEKGTRDGLNATLMRLYRPYLSKFPDTKFVELLSKRYGVSETRLMSVEQIQDLVKYMENGIKGDAINVGQ